MKPTPDPAVWAAAGYQPNKWAVEHVHKSGCRFNAYTTCRQCGKTEGLAHEAYDGLTAPPNQGDKKPYDPPFVGIIAVDFDRAREAIARLEDVLDAVIGRDGYTKNTNEHWIRIHSTNARVQWFSAENPRSVKGKTFTRVLLDEAQEITDELWFNLLPALDVRMAQIFAFGTPDTIPTSTWFEGLYLRGQDEEEVDYHSFNITCFENRWITMSAIMQALQNSPEAEFRMKYLGEWVKRDGQVFHNIDDNFRTPRFLPRPEEGASYIMGLDLAKQDDYTVAYVMDVRKKQVVHRTRFNGLRYNMVRERIANLNEIWRPRNILLDGTGPGAAVFDEMRATNLPVRSYVFSEKSKSELISVLATELERGRLILPDEDVQLKRELKAFARKVTPAGHIQYTAPVNFHDDCVMALGLAVYACRNSGVVTSGSYLSW